MPVKQRSSRKFVITANDNGDFLEIGPAGTTSMGGILVIQFNPDVTYNGSAIVMGKVFGPAAQDANVPFMPISYRRVTVNNVASDYAIVSDPITGATTIQVPSNGISIGLLMSVAAGTCTVVSWDLQGSFTS